MLNGALLTFPFISDGVPVATNVPHHREWSVSIITCVPSWTCVRIPLAFVSRSKTDGLQGICTCDFTKYLLNALKKG